MALSMSAFAQCRVSYQTDLVRISEVLRTLVLEYSMPDYIKENYEITTEEQEKQRRRLIPAGLS